MGGAPRIREVPFNAVFRRLAACYALPTPAPVAALCGAVAGKPVLQWGGGLRLAPLNPRTAAPLPASPLALRFLSLNKARALRACLCPLGRA
ncbi:MAG: hypothetical protein LBL66_10925 [Clostridiales bacterium]|nr:hypothetical protein [Clostridiales bacterium]